MKALVPLVPLLPDLYFARNLRPQFLQKFINKAIGGSRVIATMPFDPSWMRPGRMSFCTSWLFIYSFYTSKERAPNSEQNKGGQPCAENENKERRAGTRKKHSQKWHWPLFSIQKRMLPNVVQQRHNISSVHTVQKTNHWTTKHTVIEQSYLSDIQTNQHRSHDETILLRRSPVTV